MTDRHPKNRPSAVLVALTPAARHALGDAEEVPVTHFPFKIGRESRISKAVPVGIAERRLGTGAAVNDLYLIEQPVAGQWHISREHFLIEHAMDGRYYVMDRQSVCGTVVAGKPVGGRRAGGRRELHDQDVIVVGTGTSPFRFRFELSPANAES